MEAGLQGKIGFIIQARMKSTRLPGKVLFPLPFDKGKPVIKWIIDELKGSAFHGEVTVATSVNPENDVLVEYCEQNSVKFYRGDEENVLSRFINIARHNSYRAIVRLTSDNPLIDIALLDEAISYHLNNNNDYTKTEDLPLGMNYEIISPQALLSLQDFQLSDYDKEHVTPYIKKGQNFKKDIFKPVVSQELRNIRVTVDYPSDYLLLSAILSVGMSQNIKGIALLQRILLDLPWLLEANDANIQKQQYVTLTEEISAAVTILENLELNQVVSILKKYGH
jgi:spore coat polysaccharide biosynthesis protein SpsF